MKKDVQFVVIFVIALLLIIWIFGFGFLKILGYYEENVNINDINESKIVNVSSKVILNSSLCKDSDSNLNITDGRNYFSDGKTCIGKNCKQDKCLSFRNLNEYYCKDDKITSETIKCSPGSFCKTDFNEGGYCVPSIKSITLKSSMSKINMVADLKKTIIFTVDAKPEPFNTLPISVYISMYSNNDGKYIPYDEKKMTLNRISGKYELKIAVKTLQMYGNSMNLTVEALGKADNVIVKKSKPAIILMYKNT